MRKALDDQLTFELTEFRVGKVSEIVDSRWLSFVTTPSATPIELRYVDLPITIDKTVADVVFAWAWWSKDESKPKPGSDITVAEAIKSLGPSVRLGRFASFRVQASLLGRSITYKALFLFSRDQHGKESVFPIDFMTNQPALAQFAAAPMYPVALVETVYREIPFVQHWIEENELTGCKEGSHPQVCCDFQLNRCGLASEDVKVSLSKPFDPRTRFLINRKKEIGKEKQ